MPQAVAEVSFDSGSSFRALTSGEQTQGFPVEVGQQFVARLSQPHYFPVQQPLRVVVEEREPRLAFDPQAVPGAMATTPIVDMARGGQRSFVFSAWLSIFRDGTPARARERNQQVPSFVYNMVEFAGAAVLNGGGSHMGRFAGTIGSNVGSHDPANGTLIFGETPDSSVPQLASIFVPKGLDLDQPVPVHIFFSPSTGRKVGKYPFSDGDNSFNAVFHNFLTGGGKRFINQHVSSKRACIFVFPLAPPDSYFRGIQDSVRLRLYCLEAVHLAQRLVGGRLMPTARLGRCALSGFSEGGRPMNNVVVSSLSADFPELKELYCLDTVSPAGSDGDAGSYARFLSAVTSWRNAGSDRRVRIYTRSAAFASVLGSIGLGAPARTNNGAREHVGSGVTAVFTPQAFWQQLSQERAPTPDPRYDFSDLHQLMPCVFLQHALLNSGFASS